MSMANVLRRMIRIVPFGIRDKIKRLPGVAPLQRKLVERFLNGKSFIHLVDAGPASGIYFHCRLPDDKGIWTGTYELSFAQALADKVRDGCVCYDIGGWHGFFSGVMSAQGARRVDVFEPLPENQEVIAEMIALNAERDIRLHAHALGSSESKMALSVMPGSSMAKLEISEFQPDATGVQTVTVDVKTIDGLVQSGELEPPDLIKIDVEGAEAHVLRGARQTLSTYHPDLFLEVHTAALVKECEQLLTQWGYAIYILDVDQIQSTEVQQLFATKAATHNSSS